MPFDMSTIPTGRRTVLARRKTLVLDNAVGTVIALDRGCLWVTLENDPRDVVLVEGMRFEIDRRGRTIIAAEEDSRLRLIRKRTAYERVIAWLGRVSARWARRSMRRDRVVPYY